MTGNDQSDKDTKICRSKCADTEITQISYLWGQTGNTNEKVDPVYYIREQWKLESTYVIEQGSVPYPAPADYPMLKWRPLAKKFYSI